MTQTFFERKIKPFLLYVGTIGAGLMSVGYIILTFVLIFGFKSNISLTKSLVFAIINAVVGFIIMQFLKIQGIDFAKQLPANIEVTSKYNLMNAKKPKKPKHHTLKYFWVESVIKDIFGKALMTAISTAGIIYIVIEGSNDYNMILLSVVNLILFACLGFLSLVKAYDFFNDNYIPFITEKINKYEEEQRLAEEEVLINEQQEREKIIETEVQRRLDLAKKELAHERHDCDNIDSRSDILDTSLDTCITSTDCQPMVVDSGNSCDSILGRTIHTSNCSTVSMDSVVEKTSKET